MALARNVIVVALLFVIPAGNLLLQLQLSLLFGSSSGLQAAETRPTRKGFSLGPLASASEKPRAKEVAEKVEDFTEGGFCYAFCGSKTLKDFANVVCRAFWRVVVLEQFLTAHKVRLFQHLLKPESL